MLSFVRKAARSWVAAILIGLLVISFAIWGINDVFQGASKSNVAIVAGKPITAQEFKSEFDRLIKRAGKESGQAISTKEALAQGADTATLKRLVGERAFTRFLDILGIRISPDIVKGEIAKISAFQDPISKNFSQMAYQQTLNENGLDPVTFENGIKIDMGKRLLLLAATSGFHAPKAFAAQTLAYGTERRLVSMIPVPANLAGAPIKPNDAQINAFYAENKAKLMRPETRDFTIVIASLDKFAAKAKVDPAQVKQLFDAQKDKLGTPAKRSFVQIVAQDQAKADEAAKRLKAGEKAEVIAKALGLQTPLVFTDSAPDQVFDKGVRQAVFAAQTGAIGAVKGDLSYSAYQITGAKAAIGADFAKVSAQISQELAREAAGQALTDASAAYDDAIASGDNIEKAAQKAGFDIVKITNVTAEGADINSGKPYELLAASKNALNDAFALAQGDTTDLITAPNDSYIAVRADKIVASAPVPLAQVKDELTNAWIKRELAKTLKAKADTILADAKSLGFEAAAKKHNLSIIKPPQPLMRGQGSQELSAAIFQAKKGEITMGPVANGVEFAIIRVDGILRDDEKKAADRMAQAEESVRTSVQEDIAAALEEAANKSAKVKTFPDRIKAIFGEAKEEKTK